MARAGKNGKNGKNSKNSKNSKDGKNGIISPAEIGARLRVCRTQQQLTQAQLAEKVGVSYQQIQKYEAGRNSMHLGMVQLLAIALKVSAAFFLADNETVRQPELQMLATPDALVVLSYYAKLSNHRKRRQVIELAKTLAEA